MYLSVFAVSFVKHNEFAYFNATFPCAAGESRASNK